MKYEFQETRDGSHTLYLPEMGEYYHSGHGAIHESLHVYIEMGMQSCTACPLRILEVGFGTGLNAWLTMLEAETTKRKTEYISYELYPLDKEIFEKLNYPVVHDASKKPEFDKIQWAEWGRIAQISDHFSILKKQKDITQSISESSIDVVYFDAFSPDKQPEMWSRDIFENLFSIMNKGGLIVTYCAKGEIRRTMQAAGFIMERLPGPPGGKREMLRGRKV